MSDILTITGFIGSDPKHFITNDGLPITSFRLASTQRRFDRAQNRWVDADTNWFTVSAFRQTATNAAGSLHKGDRVVVTGRMHVRDWKAGEKSGTTVEIEADALGHDLFWGTTSFSRTIFSAISRPDDAAFAPAEAQVTDGSAPEDSGATAETEQEAPIPVVAIPLDETVAEVPAPF